MDTVVGVHNDWIDGLFEKLREQKTFEDSTIVSLQCESKCSSAITDSRFDNGRW